MKEEHGAGEWGTDKLTRNYKRDTPGEDETKKPKTINCPRSATEQFLWAREHGWKLRSVQETASINLTEQDLETTIARRQKEMGPLEAARYANAQLKKHTPTSNELKVMHGDMGMAHDEWKAAYKERRRVERKKGSTKTHIDVAKRKEKAAMNHYDSRLKHWGDKHSKFYMRQAAHRKWNYNKDTRPERGIMRSVAPWAMTLSTSSPSIVRAVGAGWLLGRGANDARHHISRNMRHGWKHKSVMGEAYGEDDIPDDPITISQNRYDLLKQKQAERKRKEAERKKKHQQRFFNVFGEAQDGASRQIRGDHASTRGRLVRRKDGTTKRVVVRSRRKMTTTQTELGRVVAEGKHKNIDTVHRIERDHLYPESQKAKKESQKPRRETQKPKQEPQRPWWAEEFIGEALRPTDSVEKWITHFVHSDNPKFDGISKKHRIKMAIAAWRGAKHKNHRAAHQNAESYRPRKHKKYKRKRQMTAVSEGIHLKKTMDRIKRHRRRNAHYEDGLKDAARTRDTKERNRATRPNRNV